MDLELVSLQLQVVPRWVECAGEGFHRDGQYQIQRCLQLHDILGQLIRQGQFEVRDVDVLLFELIFRA